MAPTLTLPGAGRPPLALLVDRDADTRQMYSEFLRSLACEIVEADDGRQALVHAIARHPDVIVTETRLPGISGLELCRLLREDAATADIPVLFVTADAYEHELARVRAAGGQAVLVKPCLPEKLADAIAEALVRSSSWRRRFDRLQQKIDRQLQHATELVGQTLTIRRRHSLSRSHDRRETTQPAILPLDLVCPSCDRPLKYVKSFIGGVSAKHPEQWDYFECAHGCGTFQYRQRTRKLRRIS